MTKPRIGILFGGRSGEHEVSLLSAASVLNAIDRSQYDVQLIGIAKDGRWLTSKAAERLLTSQPQAASQLPPPVAGSSLLNLQADAGKSFGVDVIFPVLHGTFGEDGTVQGLLELADIAYVGSGVLGSAASMDKDVTKRLFTAAKLPITKHVTLLRPNWKKNPKRAITQVEATLRYPVFVKPANLGSSVGISKVHDRKELAPAIDLAASFDRKIVIEQGVGGKRGKARELEVAILGNDDPQASVVGEIIPCKEFYDYEAKYLSDGSVPIIPAKLTKTEAKRIQQMAIAAFQACECSGMARVDFLMEPGPSSAAKPRKIYINEINTLPGFTSISMYPKLWAASGLAYPKLIDRLIALAQERHKEKQFIQYNR